MIKKEYLSSLHKKYCDENTDKILENNKVYYNDNKDMIAEKSRK